MELPRTPSMRLDGKRALVTGASSGIGAGCAAALAEVGAHVVCAARRADKLDEIVGAINAAGGSASALPLDIAKVEQTENRLMGEQSFDVLVNSAGFAKHTPALETTANDYDAVMDVNLRAAYFLSTLVARKLIEAEKPGSIIHIGSQMGHVGGVDRAVYCASKHALEGMVKAMAIEWGPFNVRINTICPTFVRTPRAEKTFSDPERMAWIERKIKLGRMGEIEDIMGAVVYLASDAAAMVTGSALLIDGGWTAG